MRLDLVLECQQSFLFQIFEIIKVNNLVFYTQSTSMVISGQEMIKNCCEKCS